MHMMRRGAVGRSLVSALLLLALQQGAQGRPLQAMETQPAVNGSVGDQPAQYFVRFNEPVDHYRSRLAIMSGGQVVQILHPRLDAAPELLFGFAPALEPGEYELRWTVVSLTDGDVTEGSVPFTARLRPK
jgi:methionine-rich copper-binding protein CopC